MTRALLTTCGRNILPEPNRSPTTFMPAISGPSMTSIGRGNSWRASSVSATTNWSMPLTSACSSRFSTGQLRHSASCVSGRLAGALVLGRELEQALGGARFGIGPAVEDDVLAGLAQLGRDLVVDLELAGIDDAHVHAGLDGVIEEHRVHRLAHRLVAAEREGEVADAAGDLDAGAALLDLARRLDEIDAVVVVLLDAGRHGRRCWDRR